MIYIYGMHHGGAERVVASLANNLDKDRYRVTICWSTLRGHIGNELMALGHEVIGLPEIDATSSPYLRFLVLKKLIREKSIDILHTHDIGSLVDGAQCILIGSKARLIHTYHFGNYPHLKRRYILMETLFSRVAKGLVAVGHEQAKVMTKTLHLPASRLITIYNGVEIKKSEAENDIVEPYRQKYNNPTVICSISTLTEQKGIPYLLDTAKILHQKNVNYILLIVGDGPLRQQLEEKCLQLGLENRVHFLGWIPDAAINLLPFIDIFCQSSLWEANSIALLEAMAAGVPIVTTEAGESRHIINEGKNGMIVKPRDPAGLATALESMVANPQQRQEMGQAAQRDYKEKYTVSNMISNYSELYERVARK